MWPEGYSAPRKVSQSLFPREILLCSYEVKYLVISSKNARLKSVSNPHFHTVFLYGLSSPTLPPQTPSFPFLCLAEPKMSGVGPGYRIPSPQTKYALFTAQTILAPEGFFSSLNWPFRPGAGVQRVQRANSPLCLF